MNPNLGAAVALAAILGLAACGRGGGASPSPSPASSAAAPSTAGSAARTPVPVPISVTGSRRGNAPLTLTQYAPSGRVRYTIVADALRGRYVGADTGTSELSNPHITFVADSGKRLLAVAPAGTIDEKDKTVLMSGGVRARAQDGMTLTCDTLRYDDATQRIHGRGHVLVRFPQGEQLAGDTVDWNLKNGDVEMNAQP